MKDASNDSEVDVVTKVGSGSTSIEPSASDRGKDARPSRSGTLSEVLKSHAEAQRDIGRIAETILTTHSRAIEGLAEQVKEVVKIARSHLEVTETEPSAKAVVHDVDALIDHAKRMKDGEATFAGELSTRGRLVVASVSGLLGFVAITLVVAGPAAVLGMLNTDRGWDMITSTLVLFFVLGSGVLLTGVWTCVLSIAWHLRHQEEDDSVGDQSPAFEQLHESWFNLEPRPESVCPLYLAECVLHKRFDGSILDMGKRRRSRRQILPPFERPTYRTLRELRRNKTRKEGRPTWAHLFAVWLIWQRHYPHWIVYFLTGGLWPRISASCSAREHVLSMMPALNEELRIAASDPSSAESSGGVYRDVSRKTYSTSGLKHIDRLMVVSPLYYLQLDPGFLSNHVGVFAPPAESQPFRIYSQSSSKLEWTESSFRVFTSLYVSAQRMRVRNWNLWWRIKCAERLFVRGIVFVLAGYAISIAAISVANFSNQPVTRIQIATPDGTALGSPPANTE